MPLQMVHLRSVWGKVWVSDHVRPVLIKGGADQLQRRPQRRWLGVGSTTAKARAAGQHTQHIEAGTHPNVEDAVAAAGLCIEFCCSNLRHRHRHIHAWTINNMAPAAHSHRCSQQWVGSKRLFRQATTVKTNLSRLLSILNVLKSLLSTVHLCTGDWWCQ